VVWSRLAILWRSMLVNMDAHEGQCRALNVTSYSRPAFLVEVRYCWMDTEMSFELSYLDGRDLITLMAESRFEVDAGW